MALRVLLADESSTIKKVFQLALQDFAVDVRPVNIGLDVVPVAQNFKPDIIFADVMLQKKSGYEVAADVKQDPNLAGIPVVLMWSGFVELDEDKFQASHANAQLEKPFDVGALRKLVTDLVPRTQNQRLSQFLTFPPMPEIEEKPGTGTATATQAAPAPQPPPPPGAHTAPPPLPDEDFQQISIPKMKGAQNEKYRVNLKPEELEAEHVPVEFDVPSEKIDVEEIFSTAEAEDEPFKLRENKRPATAPSAPPMIDMAEPAAPAAPTVPALSAEQLEKIIREQSAEVIEQVVWKVVPDLAAQIIERELNRLLKERDAQAF